MAARYKHMSGCSGVHVDCRLTTQPQGHVGTHAPAQGTFSACHATVGLSQILLFLGSLAPVVASMNVAASEVYPRLALFKTDTRRVMSEFGIKYAQRDPCSPVTQSLVHQDTFLQHRGTFCSVLQRTVSADCSL